MVQFNVYVNLTQNKYVTICDIKLLHNLETDCGSIAFFLSMKLTFDICDIMLN